MQEPEPIYKVIFFSNGEIYEIYAEHVYSSDLYGFIVIEGIIFGEKAQIVVDPSEERLKTEFESVPRTYIPMPSIIRIDEVEKAGTSEIRKAEGNVTYLPSMMGAGDIQKA